MVINEQILYPRALIGVRHINSKVGSDQHVYKIDICGDFRLFGFSVEIVANYLIVEIFIRSDAVDESQRNY